MSKLIDIPLHEILADEDFNSRGALVASDVMDLLESIPQLGLLQPVVVQPMEHDKFKYKLLAGFRRFFAHTILLTQDKKLGKESLYETIGAKIVTGLSEIDARILNLSENLARTELDIIQEARAVKKLLEAGMSRGEIQHRLQKKLGWVQVRCCLLELPSDIQADIKMNLIGGQRNILNLYSVYKEHGEKATYEMVKTFKNAKESGKTAIVINKLRNGKRTRKNGEILVKMEEIRNQLGNGIITRALAWTAGEISDLEFNESLIEHAKRNNQLFVPEVDYSKKIDIVEDEDE